MGDPPEIGLRALVTRILPAQGTFPRPGQPGVRPLPGKEWREGSRGSYASPLQGHGVQGHAVASFYREGGKVRNETVGNLSHLEEWMSTGCGR
jgi:hypothetical protein